MALILRRLLSNPFIMEYSSFRKLWLPILILCYSLFVPSLGKPSIHPGLSSSQSVSNSGPNVLQGHEFPDSRNLLRRRYRMKTKGKHGVSTKRQKDWSESIKNWHSPMLSELEGDNSPSKMKLIRRSKGNSASRKMRANGSGNKSSQRFRASPLLNVVRVRYMNGKYVPSESTWAFQHTGQTQYNAEANLSSSSFGNDEIKYDISNGTSWNEADYTEPDGDGISNTIHEKHGRVSQDLNSREQIRDFLHSGLPEHQLGAILSSLSSTESSSSSPQQVKEQHVASSVSFGDSKAKEVVKGPGRRRNKVGEKVPRKKKDQMTGSSLEYDAFNRSNDLRVYSRSNDGGKSNTDEHNNHNSHVKESSSSNAHGSHNGLKSELSPLHEDEQFHGFYEVYPHSNGYSPSAVQVQEILEEHRQSSHSGEVYGNHDGGESHLSDEDNEGSCNEHMEEEHSSHESDKLLLAKTIIGTKTLKVGTIVVVGILAIGIIIIAFLAKTGVFLTPLVLPLALLPVGVIALALFVPLIALFIPIVAVGLAGGGRKKRSVGGSPKGFMDSKDNENFHYLRRGLQPKSEMIYFHPPAITEVNHDRVQLSFMRSFFASLFQTSLERFKKKTTLLKRLNKVHMENHK